MTGLLLFLTPLVSFVLHWQLTMADYDPDISNGTCYYYDGYEANARYIPCGNAAISHKTCCESLDMCLSSNACYNAQYGVTYLAGCTDQSYDDGVCPRKFADGTTSTEDQQWVGLVYCNGTSNQWVACTEDDTKSDTVTKPLPCWCPDDDSRTIAFSDSSVLTNIMALPATMGQQVSWKDADAWTTEHILASSLGWVSSTTTVTSTGSTTTTVSTASATSSSESQATSSNATTSPTASSTNPTQTSDLANPTSTSSPAGPSAGINTGAKVGIAMGTLGGVAAVALVTYLIYACMRRRRRRRSQDTAATAAEVQPRRDTREPTLPQIDRRPTDPEMRSPAWSGHKSELPAEEVITTASSTTSPAPAYQELNHQQQQQQLQHQKTPYSGAEVEGSPVRSSPLRPTHDGGLRVPGRDGTYYEMAG